MAIFSHVILLVSLIALTWCQNRNPHDNNMNRMNHPSMREQNTPRSAAKAVKNQKTVTQKPPVRCAQLSFAGMGECCKESPYDLFNREAHLKCYESFTLPLQGSGGSKEYLLHLWQNFYSNNALELYTNGPVDKKNLLTCHYDCIFKNNGLLLLNPADSMAKLNLPVIAEYFKVKSEPITRAIVVEAARNCSKVVPYVMSNLRIPKTERCTPQAFIFTQCMVKEILLNCNMPIINDDGGGNFGETCKKHRRNLQNCDIMPSSLDVEFDNESKNINPDIANPSKIDSAAIKPPVIPSDTLMKPILGPNNNINLSNITK